MNGAIIGDIVGSVYEIKNNKTKKFKLFENNSTYTDDTIMTCAIGLASMDYYQNSNQKLFKQNCIKYMKLLGRMYPNAGYGGTFIRWIFSSNLGPYNSYGNGSAMRVSSVADVANSLEEAEILAEISASVTHNHPEGIKGAKAVAGAIWLAKNDYSKKEIYDYINRNYYKLNFKIDDIRESYKFDVSCQGSVPQAIQCFIESENFEDCIRNAISLGGDSDTIAAISGSIAGKFYEIPNELIESAQNYLDNNLKLIVNRYNKLFNIKGEKVNER